MRELKFPVELGHPEELRRRYDERQEGLRYRYTNAINKKNEKKVGKGKTEESQ